MEAQSPVEGLSYPAAAWVADREREVALRRTKKGLEAARALGKTRDSAGTSPAIWFGIIPPQLPDLAGPEHSLVHDKDQGDVHQAALPRLGV